MFVATDEDQARLARRAELDRDRVPGEHDEPRVVLRVVGDPAAQDHQTMSGCGFGSTNGDVRGIPVRVHQAHRRAGVEMEDL